MSLITIYNTQIGASPSGTGNGTKVTIYTTKDEYVMVSKAPKSIPQAKNVKKATAKSETKIVDTHQRENIYTFNGFLTANSTDSAAVVARNLKKIADASGGCIAQISGINYKCAILKCLISRVPMDLIIANTTLPIVAGSYIITLDNYRDFKIGDSISVTGSTTLGTTITEKCEMTTITNTGGATITATFANSYDAGAEIYFHADANELLTPSVIGDKLEYEVMIQLILGPDAFTNS
jgi:hypothetical protein